VRDECVLARANTKDCEIYGMEGLGRILHGDEASEVPKMDNTTCWTPWQ
jgi:hypothetical protein